MECFRLLDGISGGELIFVFIFILLFFGSKSIPKISRNLGRGFRYIKDATQDIQNDIRNSATDLKEENNNSNQDLIGEKEKNIKE